jgi:glyoxylase-like metal-dependent hydrolase (beta-lactamase superfamily II)
MNRWLRRLLWGIAVVAVVGGLAYYPLVRHSPRPTTSFELDLARIRVLADALPGGGPVAIRYEEVAAMRFAEAMLMAGDPWKETPMPVYSYQLVYPDRTIVIDTALARGDAKPDFIGLRYDEAAYRRMSDAMAQASLIVVTHEHMDHIGGVAAHPGLARLKPALRLTVEQLANPKGMEPVKIPADALADYRPLQYEGLHALAPGVVLVKAPGHTPGSQMVYVRRADGRELLFLGDVSWRNRNIEHVRERPLFMTLLIGEDRGAVIAQFQALHDLRRAEPALAFVPGHDGDAIAGLATAGLLQAGFR